MQSSLLQTKFYIPSPLRGFVPRLRLLDQLRKGPDRSVTVMAAPAGFGKTALIGEWIHATNPQVAEQGLEILPVLIRIVLNAAMRAQRSEHLQAEPYQHTEARRGSANGFKPKTIHTRVGDITFAIPQVREGGFYSEALEKGLRSERALTLALAEMYVQGVSTRKVKAITEQLCGVSITSSAVSQAASQLDSELANTRFSSWMPITSRSGKMDRCAIWRFSWQWA